MNLAPDSRKRKVLLIMEATLGGTGRHIIDLIRGLLACNYEVHFVYSTLRADRQFISSFQQLQYEHPELNVIEIRIPRAVTPRDAVVFWRLSNYIGKHGPFDIIHGHSTKAGFLARLVPAAQSARLYTPHGLMTMDPNLHGIYRWAVNALETFLARFSRAVIVVSGEEHQCAIETGIPEAKLCLIENGIHPADMALASLNRAKTRDSLGITTEAACIGYIGRFCEQKDPGRVLEMFAFVKRKASKPVKLIMIGFGPLEAALKTHAAALKIADDVIWPGEVDGRAYVAAFDVLAHCSRSEAFAYVFLEALASGVPFVSTRVGAAERLARADGAGFVCHPWNAEQFADLVLPLIENPDLRTALSAAARRTAAQFDAQKMVARICELYDTIAPAQNDSNKLAALQAVAGNSR